ncbi:MAG: hypothetical protein EZS28_022495 [Streblomastix strix]|uniref:Uncharacterized protein n=1 Tax=Streblomastix strix TaxID=222440 RepID=A0A5J4VI19_9EUKA|nr:MAG: hypothetical protein EZS28_022495 [Streblomastix strix]
MSQSLNISKITKKDFQPLQSLTSIGGISKQIAVAAQEAGDVSLQKENIDSNLKDQTFSGQQFTTTGSGGGKFAQHRPDSTFQFASKVAARSEIATPSDCAQDYYVSHDTTNKLCEKMSTKQRTTVYSQPKASDDIYGSNAIKVSQRYALGSIDKFYEVHLDVVQNRSPQLVDMKRTTTRANNRGGLRTGSQGGGRSGGTRPKISSGYLDEDDGNDLYGVVENDALYNVRDDILSKRPSSKSATLSHSLQTPHPSMRIQPHFSATNTRTEAEINYEKADKPVRFRTDKTMPFGKSDQPLMLVTHSNNYGRQNKIDPYTGKQYHPTDTADSRGNALPIELYDVKIDVTRRRFPQQIPFGFDQREKLYRPKTLTADLDYCPDVTSGIWLQQKLDAAEKKELDQERQYAINSLQQSNIPQEQVGNESGIGASQASGELLHNQQQKNVRQRSRSADAFLSDTINMQKKQDIKKNGILAKVAPSLIDEYDKLRENLEWRSSQKGSSTLLNSSKLPLSLTTTSLYVPDKDDFTLVSAGVRQHNSIIPFTSYPTRAQVDVERFNDKQLDKFYESGKGDDVVRRKNVINVDISNVISRKSNVISHFTSIPPLNDLMYDPIKGEKVVSRHIRAADLRNGAGGGRRQTGEGSITGYMKANDTVPFYDMQQAVSYIKPRILGTKIAPKINS